ncbi:PAS domain S-box-containing protein [Kineococcus radiotolerans]|uniref:PAS domain S-box-containing protein n=1 Tax=Kineococcus radiotolerans TaxID=131568 RepID=A0A7W4TQN6_KINRA|nr:PAS domain S-box-containing protein [Kineococcus radiotolerans]
MSEVVGDAPAAVLLVDLTTREVVHTNTVADHLAPDVHLPLGIDAWSDAAALADLEGERLSETIHPLSRVARSEPVLGQAVSAARVSELGRQREPLWVVALPMADAPMLADHALVVLLPLRQRAAAQAALNPTSDVVQHHADLRDRAVLATGLSFTVVDARADDLPLAWVNPAFTATTGYTFDDSVGRNCRFLQGPGTDPAAVQALRDAIAAGEDLTLTLLNYRKDGSAFWNQLSMNPIHGPDGELTHFVGIQTDVTTRVEGDEERERALRAETTARREAEDARREAEDARAQAERAQSAAEQAQAAAEIARSAAETAQAAAEKARATAEKAQARLALLAEATSQLAITLDVAECRQRLLDLVVPGLADWALLITTTEHGATGSGAIDTVLAKHTDPARSKDLDAYVAALRRSLAPGSPRTTLLGDALARRVSDYDSPQRRAERERWVNDATVLDRSDALGAASTLFVALPGRRHSDDVMILVRGTGQPRHSEADLGIAVDLARRAGLILDNARLYEQQHTIAATLQDSLLPTLPTIPGIRAAARYRAAASGAQVGGDFYELISLPGDAIGLAIGDVVGHDVLAAAAMGHLRGLLRACAWNADNADSDPARVLERVDELLAGLGLGTLATLTYAHLTPDTDEDATAEGGPVSGWALRYSNAGHPPLMLRTPEGTVTALDGPHDLLLGVVAQERATSTHHLPAGSTLLAYTDGLVERRGEHLADGLERLAAAFAAGPEDPDELCTHLLQQLGSEGDDTAVLALQV